MAPTKVSVYGTPSHKRSTIKKKENKPRETVGVFLRLRPIKLDEPTLAKIDDKQVKTLPPDGSAPQVLAFTQVFDNAPQSEIFDKVARPVAEEFVSHGKDGLIFTYGITGSGKTYTMEGLKSDPGLIYRTIDFLFNSIGSHQTRKGVIESDGQNFYRIQEQEQLYPNLCRVETPSAVPSVIKWQNRTKESAFTTVDPTAYYCLFISLIELYNKQVYDLFEEFDSTSMEKGVRRREIRTDPRGMSYVANAVEIEVKSADEAVELYTRGVKRRKTGATNLNQESSRGHCVLNLKLVHVRKSYDDQFDLNTLVSSQLCLVDLAGSERAKRSHATGGALHEAGNINNSLGALRKCIRALRDGESTNSIQYREYSLTRLFKSYFEGHGSVCMVLCVKPTVEDFVENGIAMEFGLLTQDVAIDYASPPKMFKRSKSRGYDDFAAMYEYMDRKKSMFEPSKEMTDEEVHEKFLERLKSHTERRKKYIETSLGAQNEVRQNILKVMTENDSLRRQYETRAKEVRCCQEQAEILESKLGSTERSKERLENTVKALKMETREKERQIHELDSDRNRLRRDKEKLMKDVLNLSESRKEVLQLLRKLKPSDWGSGAVPSAPELEPLHSSSPVNIHLPSTSSQTNTDSQTPPPTTSTETNVSSDGVLEFQEHHRSPIKNLLASPANGGVPIVNPRHNRSLSCSNMQWIHHKPSGTIDLGTVLKPKFKNGRSVKNLRSSDILRKDAAGYSVVHQDAEPNGDVNTSIYKGHIISTVCGGAQVILDDIETMKQISPKRKKRPASDAHYTR